LLWISLIKFHGYDSACLTCRAQNKTLSKAGHSKPCRTRPSWCIPWAGFTWLTCRHYHRLAREIQTFTSL